MPPTPNQARASGSADRAAVFAPAGRRYSHRLLSQRATQGVMGKPLDLSREAIAVERLDRLNDPRMKVAAAPLQQSAVRDLVRKRVLEGALEIRIEPGLGR